jgi:hypothetical protein
MTGSPDRLRTLESVLRAPGGIELSIREDARLLLPISTVYDHPLDSKLQQHDICDAFIEALERGEHLENTRCFRSECVHIDSGSVICPSGFWGFRHRISVPVSQPSAGAAWPNIESSTDPEIIVGLSRDPRFIDLRKHARTIRTLAPTCDWKVEDNRDGLMKAFRMISPHLVYLFCHAGLEGNEPYVHVGGDDDAGITGDQLYYERINWSRTRPLVFINGCETGAATPEVALALVNQFMRNTYACGAIGTEITAFEPLAISFAEAFFPSFFAGSSIAEAVRLARLALLEAGNPLGLIYVPFVPIYAALQHTVAPRAA